MMRRRFDFGCDDVHAVSTIVIFIEIRSLLFFRYLDEVLAVLVLDHRLGQLTKPFGCDPAFSVGYFLQTGDLEPLTFLDDLDVGRGLGKGFVSARVQPCETSSEFLDASAFRQ